MALQLVEAAVDRIDGERGGEGDFRRSGFGEFGDGCVGRLQLGEIGSKFGFALLFCELLDFRLLNLYLCFLFLIVIFIIIFLLILLVL